MNLGQTKRPPSSSSGRTALFAAVFRVHSAGQLRDALRIGSAPTPAAAFRAEGTALQPVLSWENNGLLAANDFDVYPNPFGQAGVWLRQTEPSEAESSLRIFDATGKVLSQKKWIGQQTHIPAEVFPQKGVYWYEVRQGAQKWSGKIVFQ